MTLKTPAASYSRLALPVGVSGFEPSTLPVGSLAFALNTDQLRLKKSTGWADVSGGGGSPTGAAGGDLGSTYPNPTVTALHETSGPTKLTLGAIADGQLLARSGTTVVGVAGAAPSGSAGGDLGSTYPNPTVTAVHTGATQLTVGTISDGQVVVRSGTTLIGSSAFSGANANPWLALPTSPSADDDEMTSWPGSWIVWDATANVNLTAVNTFDPWTFPSSGTYRWSVFASTFVRLQFPLSSNNIIIYKPITPAANMLVWSRFTIGANFQGGTSNTINYAAFALFPDNSGRPLISGNGFTGGIILVTGGNRTLASIQQGVTQDNASIFNSTSLAPDMVGVMEQSSSQRQVFFSNSFLGDLLTGTASPYTATRTTAYVGWRVLPPSVASANGMCPAMFIDFFRRKNGATAWITD